MTKIFPEQLADGGVGARARASAREHYYRLGLDKMGRADPGREMELRAPEDAPEACRACRDVNLFETLTLTIIGDVFQARRDDPYPFSCTRRLTGEQKNEQQHTYEYDCEYCSLLTFSDCPRSVEEAKTFILPFLHAGGQL